MVIVETGPVTVRRRVREIDDDEGRRRCGFPAGQWVRGDVAAGAALGPHHYLVQ